MHSGDIYLKRFGNREKVKNYWKRICDETITKELIMKLIKLKEVIEITCLTKATIYRMIADGKFPKQVSLGDRAVAWVYQEIENWVNERINAR